MVQGLPEFPNGCFVTGTDTGVGKTFASAALLHALRRDGRPAVGMKPVASGCERTPQGWRNEDALALQAASHPRPEYLLVNPYALPEPTAPQIAITAPTDRSTPLVAITAVIPMARMATGAPRFSTSIRLPNKRPSCHVTEKNPGNSSQFTNRTAASAITCGRAKNCAKGRPRGIGG